MSTFLELLFVLSFFTFLLFMVIGLIRMVYLKVIHEKAWDKKSKKLLISSLICFIVSFVSLYLIPIDDVETEELINIEESPKYEFTEGPILRSEGYGIYYIEGILRNNTEFDKDYIQVTFTLYDEAGNNIGWALANTGNLKTYGTWKFKAYCFSNSNSVIHHFDIDEVSGF